MIDLLKSQFGSEMSIEEKANRVREFLQIVMMKIIYDKGYFENLAFVGGTALRILHNLRRFSEDMDFSVIRKSKYNFSDFVSEIEKGLKLFGMNVEKKVRKEKVIQSVFFKFSGLLSELGLSPLKEQKLSIRLEIDTNPPRGWKIETSFINKIYLFTLVHFDLPFAICNKITHLFFQKVYKRERFLRFNLVPREKY
jgi:hypothetical protein